MKNRIKLCIGLSVLFAMSATATICKGMNNKTVNADDDYCYVDFFNNYKREDFTLSSNFSGKGNNLLYLSVKATRGALLEKPTDPERKNYAFVGWYLDEVCSIGWNFATDKVNQNMRLFAKWDVASNAEILEPTYTPPSTVLEDSAETDYVIDSIMHFTINYNYNQIKVSTAALMKLEANKDNILPLMEYRVKNGKEFTATYNDKKITVTCNGVQQVINVVDDSINLVVDNSTYEQKAKNYEAKALEKDSYHVMLAGSSSIEFWEDSTEVLEPIVSFNHGIGGTTIEQWDELLNKRLVFPFKPKMVVYYVGINNVINSKESQDVIWNRLLNFFNHTHEAMPNTKVQYILMNQLPGYPGYKDTINYVNNQAIEYQKSNPWLTLINPGLKLLKDNGEPDASYFRTDGLHLSHYGYIIWGGIIKQSIIDGLNK